MDEWETCKWVFVSVRRHDRSEMAQHKGAPRTQNNIQTHTHLCKVALVLSPAVSICCHDTAQDLALSCLVVSLVVHLCVCEQR